MVDNVAIAQVIQKLTDIKEAPCKKTLQKIVFLIEAKKGNLGCDYGIHFYGPYSADLDYAVKEMAEDGILSIEYTPTKHRISVAEKNNQPLVSNEIIDAVVQEFGKDSPSELELLATTLYVYMELNNPDSILSGVQKIKGAKYSVDRIEKAISRLQCSNYIS